MISLHRSFARTMNVAQPLAPWQVISPLGSVPRGGTAPPPAALDGSTTSLRDHIPLALPLESPGTSVTQLLRAPAPTRAAQPASSGADIFWVINILIMSAVIALGAILPLGELAPLVHFVIVPLVAIIDQAHPPNRLHPPSSPQSPRRNPSHAPHSPRASRSSSSWYPFSPR